MALCDICNAPGMGTIVSSSNFKKAVQNGFNPFKAGLAPDVMSAFGLNGFEEWRKSALYGAASHSDWNVCSKCMSVLRTFMGSSNSSGGCYIATACYGDYNSVEVVAFRKFRDTYLLKNYFGKLFVKLYYTYSPYWAEKLKKHKSINRIVKNCFLDTIYSILKR